MMRQIEKEISFEASILQLFWLRTNLSKSGDLLSAFRKLRNDRHTSFLLCIHFRQDDLLFVLPTLSRSFFTLVSYAADA